MVSPYNVVLFDLDGTLTDPKVGITNSILYALSKMNIEEPDVAKLTSFIGPPLHNSFKSRYLLSDTQAQEAVGYYREYYSRLGIYENAVYPGIPTLLSNLKNGGRTLAVATSKPTPFAVRVLEYFKILDKFYFVAGSNLDGTRSIKSEVIEFALSLLPGVQKQQIIMVGDREHDILGAKCNGISSLAVTYGYGSIDELAAAGPAYTAKTVQEIGSILGSQSSDAVL